MLTASSVARGGEAWAFTGAAVMVRSAVRADQTAQRGRDAQSLNSVDVVGNESVGVPELYSDQ